MFKLKTNILEREFEIKDGKFSASEIKNTASGMNFVPDKNSCEFVIHFIDGSNFSSNGLPVRESHEEGNGFVVAFAEKMGISVTVKYFPHKDGNTLCKQIILNQSGSKAIDYIELESIGITNSKSNFTVGIMPDGEISGVRYSLGQPFYVDSLFFGCEFPATMNQIEGGKGSVKYYLGESVGKNFSCPVTVIGGAKGNSQTELQKAFFNYIESISVKTDLRFQFNSWYDHMRDINEENILYSFSEIHKMLKKYSAPALDSYVVDDGWVDFKAPFWSFNKKFPNGMTKAVELCKSMGSSFGMWLGPRGGYNDEWKLAKRFQRNHNGYYNKQGKEICVASGKYVANLTEFLCAKTAEYDINYWKLDGFTTKVCRNKKHDHKIGGPDDMYYVTDLWQKWIKLYTKLRETKSDMWINMTCYANVSPWWLQWVNSMWIQNSSDIGFAKNQANQSQLDSEITYRDGRYFECFRTKKTQFPLKNIYNHEPIYGNTAKVNYTDEEFRKFVYWCMVRGQALNELYLSPNMMNEAKWRSLSECMNYQKDNYHILRNANYFGGNPLENKLYGYISWSENGEGIIALRNPDSRQAEITLTLDKLINTPECLKDAKRNNVYCESVEKNDGTYSYGSEVKLTLKPFEIIIFKISQE